MESTIRYVLLIIGFLILLGILLDGIIRNRKKNKVIIDIKEKNNTLSRDEPLLNVTSLEIVEPVLTEKTADVNPPPPSNSPLEEILSLRIMSKNRPFGGYHLLQTLLANNLHYGSMQIFHYYSDSEYRRTLFSLVSASEPGDFDLNNIGSFSCPGIILFCDPQQLDNPLSAFDQMWNTAKQLANDLNGKIELAQNQEATLEAIEAIRQRLGAQI